MTTFYPDDPTVRLLARDIERQESKTRSKAVFLMALGVVLIILLTSFFAYSGWERARSAQIAAMSARIAATRALDLAMELERSKPVLAVSPDGKHAISQAGWLLDASGTPIEEVASGGASGAAFSPDGRLLLVVSRSTAILFEVGGDRMVRTFPNIGHVTSAVFSPGNQILMVTSSEGVFRVQVSDGQIGRLQVDGNITFATFAPTSKTILLATLEGALLVSTDEGRTFARRIDFGGDALPIRAAALDDHERKILVTKADGSAVIVNLDTGAIESKFVDVGQNSLR